MECPIIIINEILIVDYSVYPFDRIISQDEKQDREQQADELKKFYYETIPKNTRKQELSH